MMDGLEVFEQPAIIAGNDTSLESLKRARASLKGKLTRLASWLHSIDGDESLCSEDVELRIQLVQTVFKNFENVQDKIESIFHDDSENELQRSRFEDQYLHILPSFQRLLKSLTPVTSPPIISQLSADNGSINGNNASHAQNSHHFDTHILPPARISLPPISIPSFDGEPEKYESFKELFNSIVDMAPGLSDVSKFYYLRSALTGRAANVISAIPITGENYKLAWNLLTDRFQCRAHIIDSLNTELLTLPYVNTESATALRSLLDKAIRIYRSLKSMGAVDDTRDSIFVTIVNRKIDPESRKEYRLQLPANSIPTFESFYQYMDKRVLALESLGTSQQSNKKRYDPKAICAHQNNGNKMTHERADSIKAVRFQNNKMHCVLCGSSDHRISRCPNYQVLDIPNRRKIIDQYRLCRNCMGSGHVQKDCKSEFFCFHCKKKGHHSSIHENRQEKDISIPTDNLEGPSVSLFNTEKVTTQILLSTAQVYVHDVNGRLHLGRCILDSAAQCSFITQTFASKLGLPLLASHLNITGIGQIKGNTSHRVFTTIQSRVSRYKRNIELFVLPTITSSLPTETIDCSKWRIPENLPLADPDFSISSPIDILIGAQLFLDILHKGSIRANNYHPAIRHTHLGWIFGGQIPSHAHPSSVNVHLTLEERVEQFWKLEESPTASKWTPEEEMCEKHFLRTHTRDETGRFVVHLPFKRNPDVLGSSRLQAKRRWLSVEARLNRDIKLHDEYTTFMKNYLDLGHMTLLGTETEFLEKQAQFYVPHHCVFKPMSTSTAVRTVFDMSAKSSNGISLNDILLVGPTIQCELFQILLRFRRYKYVFMSDVQKMFRQILIAHPDRSQQLIFWREKVSDPLQIFQLNTITYGTNSAPFLATRCLRQLAIDESEKYPAASSIIDDFYVDDAISGHNDLNQALLIQRQLIDMLASAGFPLKKWASNHPKLLEKIPETDREKLHSLSVTSDEAVKTLGLTWIPDKDIFVYDSTKLIDSPPARTKRQVLSQLSKLFDPLGILNPIICNAKIFMQGVWQQKLSWDDLLPAALIEEWNSFNISLSQLHSLHIPRHVSSSNRPVHYQLHGFSDSSERAYGSCIYLRTTDENGFITTRLLCSKSRVAPLKQVTLPRLELSAALLLVKQMISVISALKIPDIIPYCWSDSTIVLAWLQGQPHQWKTFIANRVAEIQNFDTTWNHISSSENPADIISRGATVEFLKNSQLWWDGPECLKDTNEPWTRPPITFDISEIPEKRKVKIVTVLTTTDIDPLFSRFSSLTLLTSVVSWCLRFSRNAKFPNNRQSGPLTPEERNQAFLHLIIKCQKEGFSEDIHALLNKGHVSKKSKLIQLNPYLDEEKALRVGGRLKNASISYDRKHPYILPPKHPFTSLIIINEHIRSLHGGPQLILGLLRQKFWIINGRNIIRKAIYPCVNCFRAKPNTNNPRMGQLPHIRTEPARPFLHAGVDFSGPFFLRPGIRSRIKLKCYVAVFLCMVTKSVHLEIVGSLSTEGFLAALKRFISRRGLCATISCDNGTNFVGAKNHLKEVYDLLRKNSTEISDPLSKMNIKWIFIPPHTPHWGGLWESAVKSMKNHLRRVAGLASLNIEEFSTILCCVEACLNSRPLTPLSTDPNDLQVLTPGHFLIGAPLLAVPELDHTGENISRLTRWHRVQSISQHFWKRWSLEYIATLTPFTKWTKDTNTPILGRLVLIKEDNLPPLHWRLGRVTDIHPGKDGITRVVSVNTKLGSIKRHVRRIFPLPIE